MENENTNLNPEVEETEVEPVDDYELDFDEDESFDEFDGDEEESADEVEEESEAFTVKFNGEEKKLSRDEMITAAQKGLNYDKIKSRLDSFESGPIHKAMKAAAEKAGMSIEDYATFMLENSEADAQLEAEREIRNKYPDAPAEMVKELAGYRTKKTEAGSKDKEQSAEEKAWAEALREYPDTKVDELPEDVMEDVKNGASPLMALKNHEIRELKKQQSEAAVREKNAKNKKASLGSLRTNKGDDGDPFLKGYLS